MAERPGMELVDQIFGIINAQKFMLENLYTLALAGHHDPSKACNEAAAKMLAQFEQPATNEAALRGGESFAITQHGLTHLEGIWESIARRVQAGRDGLIPTPPE